MKKEYIEALIMFLIYLLLFWGIFVLPQYLLPSH